MITGPEWSGTDEMKKALVKEALAAMDRDGNGSISFREFESFVVTRRPDWALALLGWTKIFSSYVQEGHDEIKLDGVKLLIRDVVAKQPSQTGLADIASQEWVQHQAEQALLAMDTDNNGGISYHEFITFAKAHPEQFRPLETRAVAVTRGKTELLRLHQDSRWHMNKFHHQAIQNPNAQSQIFFEQMRQLFLRLDSDNDEYLTFEELKELIRDILVSQGTEVDEQRVQREASAALEAMDVGDTSERGRFEGDKQISFEEFRQFVDSRPALFAKVSGWQSLFSRYADLAGGKRMSLLGTTALVRAVLVQLGQAPTTEHVKEEALALVQAVDANGDGLISFREFLQYVQREDKVYLFAPLRSSEERRMRRDEERRFEAKRSAQEQSRAELRNRLGK